MKYPMLTLRWISFFILALVSCTALSGFTKHDFLSAEEIMKRVREHHTKHAEIGVLSISILDADGEVTQRKAISIFQPSPAGEGYKSLIRYIQPKLVYGTTLLTVENPDGSVQQTLYRPRTGNFKDVTHGKLRNHIGKSPFEFEDLTQENPSRYQYSRLLNESIDGIPCYQIMASPLYEEDKERLHQETRILYIARANFDIIKIQYFDDKGNITRVFEGYDFSEGDTALNPDRGIMNDKKNKVIATVVINQRDTTPTIPENLFTKEFIKNWGPEEDKKLLKDNTDGHPGSSKGTEKAPTAESIIKKLSERSTRQSELGLLRINLIDSGGNMQQRKAISVFNNLPKQGSYQSIIHYVEPESIQGFTIMTQKHSGKEVEQLLYTPQTGFINARGKDIQDFFPETPYEFEDLISEDPENYNYKKLDSETVNGVPCYVIQATPKTKKQKALVHYAYRILFISETNYALVKTQFYNRKGTLTRVFEGYDLSEKHTSLIPDRGVMVDKENGTSSIVTVVHRKENPRLPSNMFTRKFIKNWNVKTNENLLEANAINLKKSD